MKTIRAIIKLRYISMDSDLKVRAKHLDQMREVVENKIRKLPRILDRLMTALKTRKEEQIVS